MTERPARPRELEDPLNYHFYHPVAWRLARALARTPVTPNAVSVVGGACVVAAGLCYAAPLWGWTGPALFAMGLALHLAWHVIDGADGDLARMTGRSSPRGEMIDGLSDYLSHFLLYILLAMVLAETLGGRAWAIAIAAGVAHVIQSNHVESQRRFYLRWVYDKPWLVNAAPDVRGLLGWVVTLYLRVAVGLNPHALAIDRAVTAAEGDPARREALRFLVRTEWAPMITLEKWLGPNQRAVALGASMLLTGSPLAYFAFGGLWLTVLLAVSVVAHNRTARRLATRIAALG
jgi:hypothetical protein